MAQLRCKRLVCCNFSGRFAFPTSDPTIDMANGFELPQDYISRGRAIQRRRRSKAYNDTQSTSDYIPTAAEYNLSDVDTLPVHYRSYLETRQPQKTTHKNAPTKPIENVKNLTASTFSSFIKNQGLAVVMFHNNTTDNPGAVSAWITHSLKAPRGVNPAFASVDCATEAELCAKEAIAANPLFKLYSWGYLINSVKDLGQLNYYT